MAEVSVKLRPAKSVKVIIQPLCDILFLYSKTITYFTPQEYHKCRGNEICIRKCDVKNDNKKDKALDVVDQGMSVYKNSKEYDRSYIWGQLVGWFKQTVDKPNASLSADRRGTLSIPDLESFIVT